MRTKINYLRFDEYLRRERELLRLRRSGVEFYGKHRDYFKLCLGVLFLGIAIIPNGLGFMFYPLSFMMLGITRYDIKIYKDKSLDRIRRKLKYGI